MKTYSEHHRNIQKTQNIITLFSKSMLLVKNLFQCSLNQIFSIKTIFRRYLNRFNSMLLSRSIIKLSNITFALHYLMDFWYDFSYQISSLFIWPKNLFFKDICAITFTIWGSEILGNTHTVINNFFGIWEIN